MQDRASRAHRRVSEAAGRSVFPRRSSFGGQARTCSISLTTSPTGVPLSAWRNAYAICSSENFERFIGPIPSDWTVEKRHLTLIGAVVVFGGNVKHDSPIGAGCQCCASRSALALTRVSCDRRKPRIYGSSVKTYAFGAARQDPSLHHLAAPTSRHHREPPSRSDRNTAVR